MRTKNLCLLICFLGLGQCDNSDFTEFSELGGLRVFAVVASASEIDGTQTGSVNVTLTPYLSDIEAGGRVFTVSVVSCVDPTFAQTGQLGCQAPQQETYPNGNTFDTNTLAASSFTGAMDPLTITINNPAALIAPYSNQLQFNGVPLFVFFTISAAGEQLQFVKELRISNRGALNQNPVIDEVTFNGQALINSPDSSGELAVNFTNSGSPETFVEINQDGTTLSSNESYLVSWFTSKGKVSPGRVLANDKSKLTLTERTLLICVVRDRRGGTDVRIFNP